MSRRYSVWISSPRPGLKSWRKCGSRRWDAPRARSCGVTLSATGCPAGGAARGSLRWRLRPRAGRAQHGRHHCAARPRPGRRGAEVETGVRAGAVAAAHHLRQLAEPSIQPSALEDVLLDVERVDRFITVTAVTTPKAPRPTTTASKISVVSAGHRAELSTTASTSSTAVTDADSAAFADPDPWVPAWMAPPTEMLSRKPSGGESG